MVTRPDKLMAKVDPKTLELGGSTYVVRERNSKVRLAKVGQEFSLRENRLRMRFRSRNLLHYILVLNYESF